MPVARCRHDDSRRKCTKKNPASQAPRPENTLPLPSEKEEAKPATGFIKKRKKLQISWTESSKNSKNCEFRGRNRQKTAKTGFPHPGESQHYPFSAFPHPGERQNQPETAFPNFGKGKISQKLRFPTLGKTKSPKKRVSQPWERQNQPKTAFPNLGKDKNQKIGRIACPIG